MIGFCQNGGLTSRRLHQDVALVDRSGNDRGPERQLPRQYRQLLHANTVDLPLLGQMFVD